MIPTRLQKSARSQRNKLRRWTSAFCAASLLGGAGLLAAEPDTVKLRVGGSELLRAKASVHRTAVVDPAVCEIAQFTPREVSLIGRRAGQTQVTFWFDDPAMAPLTYVIDVQ
jgi:Flp pilus assembly secretin CpaC